MIHQTLPQSNPGSVNAPRATAAGARSFFRSLLESGYGKSNHRWIGLQFRATLLIGTATLIALQFTQGMYFDQMRSVSIERQKENAVSQTKCMAEGIELALAGEHGSDIAGIVERLAHDAGIEIVAVFDTDGRVLAKAGHTDDPNVLLWRGTRSDAWPQLGIGRYISCDQADAGHIVVDYPVRRHAESLIGGSDSLYGYVRMGVGTSQEFNRLQSAIGITSGMGLFSLLLIVALAFLAARQFVLPINELTQTAKRLAAGDLSARSQVRRSDEIGDLACSFNDMAAKLQRSHKAITSLNADLENRVRERTEHLSVLAHQDPLTRLHNRRYFDEQLAVRFDESRRYGTEFSCMMMDIDGFKPINDAAGHGVGDEILRTLGKAIRETVRASDLAARYGGDEFVILLPHTDAFSAQTLGERILEHFVALQTARTDSEPATVSIGVATASESRVDSAAALLASADQALYQAKRLGKNRLILAHAPA